MKRKRWLSLIALALSLSLLLAGCGSTTEDAANGGDAATDGGTTESSAAPTPSPTSGDKVSIGLTLPFYNDPYFIEMRDVIEAFCIDRGWDFAEFDGANDPAKQANGVDNFISSGVTALVICPVDSDAIVASIEKANERGIPVFTVDCAANGGDVVCHIETDNFQAGEVCAEWIVQNIEARPLQIAVGYFPGAASTRDRYDGFKSYLAENGVDYEIIDEQKGVSVDEGMKVGEAWAASTAKEAHAIYATDDNTGYGIMQALVNAGITDVPITSVDGQDFVAQAMLDGLPYGCSAAQRPGLMGELIMEAVERYLDGQSVPRLSQIPAFAITVDNAADIIAGEGYPPFAVDWDA